MIDRPLTRASAALALAAPLVLAACAGGGGASYPDRPGVSTAQAGWCAALAKLDGAGSSWEHAAACRAAFPTASAQYIKGMTKCLVARTEAAGKNAPDRSQLLAECNDEVTVGLRPDEASAREVLEARCARMERCEKVARPECKAALDRLETAVRATFTITYNQAALHEVAGCLASSSCRDDEDAAREACYKPATEKLLWFP
jgi:hypothetical protein